MVQTLEREPMADTTDEAAVDLTPEEIRANELLANAENGEMFTPRLRYEVIQLVIDKNVSARASDTALKVLRILDHAFETDDQF